MAEDQSLLIGRLQAGLENLNKIVESIVSGFSEFRDAMADERRIMDARVRELELRHQKDMAREKGMLEGTTKGIRIGAVSIVLLALVGAKTGASWLWETVVAIIK